MGMIRTAVFQLFNFRAGSAAAVAAGMAAFALGSDWNGSLRIPVSVKPDRLKACINFEFSG